MKRIILIVLLVAACVGAGVCAYEIMGRAQRSRVYEALKTDAVAAAETITAPMLETAKDFTPAVPSGPAQIPEPVPTAPPYVSPIDFSYLWSIDPYIFAWITIEGTNIDYPIAKHPTDDSYYLFHTIEGYSGYPGAIYAFGYTAADFSQFNTIVYGHNMASGTMFADLNRYQDRSYMDAHRTVKIYTPDAEYSYTAFAFVYYDDRLIDTWYDQRVEADRQEYLDSLDDLGSSRTYVLDDVEVGTDSHILTLATCHNVSTERTLLVAVRDDEE